MNISGGGGFKQKPFKIGDDIHNSDYCQVGHKFNTRLVRCVPNDAIVGKDGTVTIAYKSADSNFDRNPTPPPQPPSKPVAQDPITPDQAVKVEGNIRKKSKIAKSIDQQARK